MSVTSTSHTAWTGGLATGDGDVRLGTGAARLAVDWKARAEGSSTTTTPEELLAAAHSACYSMALSHELAEAGITPLSVDTRASVTFVPGTGITGIALEVEASIEGGTAEDFARVAEATKTGCPVSAALAAVPLTLSARLRD